MPRYINVEDALQAHPEFLNEQIDDHDKAVYAKGWNACNSAFYGAIKELPTVSPDEVRGVGKWKKTDAFPHRVYCSNCFKTIVPNEEYAFWSEGIMPRNYCPSCGAKMEVTSDA